MWARRLRPAAAPEGPFGERTGEGAPGSGDLGELGTVPAVHRGAPGLSARLHPNRSPLVPVSTRPLVHSEIPAMQAEADAARLAAMPEACRAVATAHAAPPPGEVAAAPDVPSGTEQNGADR